MMRSVFTAVLVGFVVAPGAWASSLEDARGKVAEYRTELAAAAAAQQTGDQAGFQKHAASAQSRLQDARAGFDEAEANASDDPLVLRDYAAVLLEQEEFDLAVKVLKRATRISPDEAPLWTSLGQALARMGRKQSKEAQQALKRALSLDDKTPAAVNTYAVLGRLYRQEGLGEVAERYYKKAVELDPNHAESRLGLVALDIQAGKVSEASAAMDSLRALPPTLPEPLPTLLSNAIDAMELSHHAFADTAANHMAYAKLLFRAGRTAESLAAAERSAKLNPGDFATWNFVGDLSQAVNNPERAKQAYAQSLQLKPDQPRTQDRLNALTNTATPLLPMQ